MVGRESCRVGLLSTVENPWVLLAASVLKRQTDLRASCPSPARSGMQGKPLSHAEQRKGGPCLPGMSYVLSDLWFPGSAFVGHC